VAISSSVKLSSLSLMTSTTSSAKLSSSSTSSKAIVTLTSAATAAVMETITFTPTGIYTSKGQVYWERGNFNLNSKAGNLERYWNSIDVIWSFKDEYE
jgi:hypothetical protein